MRRILLLLVLCASAGSATAPKPLPLGYWGTAAEDHDDIAETAAHTQLAMVAAGRVGDSANDADSYLQRVEEAVEHRQRVIVILWTLLMQGDPAAPSAGPDNLLRPDWEARLESFKARVWSRYPRGTFFAYYLFDEPGLWALERGAGDPCLHLRLRNSLELIAARLPRDAYRMVSLSVPEVDGSVEARVPRSFTCAGVPHRYSTARFLPAGVDLVGGNFYTLTGSPAGKAMRHLDALAAIVGRRRLYLTLDAVAQDPGGCRVSAATQQALTANNRAMRAWAASHSKVVAQIAFVYADLPAQKLCGARSMPAVLRELRSP